MINESKILKLEKLYSNCKAYHGELHDHSNSGGTSDGRCTLKEWISEMKKLNIDFATILDHRQVLHMYSSDWDEKVFIGGSEPGTFIIDCNAKNKGMHYNMVFAKATPLEELLEEFSEFQFEGGKNGHFIYPSFTRKRFCQLIDTVIKKGGFFVYPHPTQIMDADDPLEYWFCNETGIEIFYGDMDSEDSKKNYQLWIKLLSLKKRLYACAGGDKHFHPGVGALTTIYSEIKHSSSYIEKLRAGDFTCGPVGIRMCIGNTKTGGVCDFSNQELIVAVGDFHESVYDINKKYRVDIISSDGICFSKLISCDKMNYFCVNCSNCDFYRVEVYDVTKNQCIAIGNPIWNSLSF